MGAKYTTLFRLSRKAHLRPALYPASLSASLQRGQVFTTQTRDTVNTASVNCRLSTRIADLASRQSLFTGFPALKTAPPSITSIISIQYFTAGIRE